MTETLLGLTFRCLTLAILWLVSLSAAAAADLKVFISADMEGVAGVVSRDQVLTEGFEFEQFRRLMTAEVNAAIEAARDAGATEIVVGDSHGTGLSLLVDELPQDILLARGWPRPLGMMGGIDDSFDAALFIGFHGSAANPDGVLAHTQSGDNFSSLKIDGIEMSEGSMNAMIAGHFGVPVVMISGDAAAVEEVSAFVGPIEGAVVKWHTSHTSAVTMMPEAARELIKEKVRAGLRRRNDLKPLQVSDSLTMDLTFKNDLSAEMLAYLPNVERVDNYTVRFVGNIVEISMFVEMVLGFPPTMAD